MDVRVHLNYQWYQRKVQSGASKRRNTEADAGLEVAEGYSQWDGAVGPKEASTIGRVYGQWQRMMERCTSSLEAC